MSQGGVLSDGSVRLRPARLPDDVAIGPPWYTDPEVLRFSEGEGTPAYDRATVERMYRHLAERGELYIIEVEDQGHRRAIGDTALCRDALPIVIGEAAYRSRGLGARVLRLLVDRARALGWDRLAVQGVYTSNERARRLFERAGFVTTGCAADEQGVAKWQMELRLR